MIETCECGLEFPYTYKGKGRPKTLCDFCVKDRYLERRRKANRAYYHRSKRRRLSKT